MKSNTVLLNSFAVTVSIMGAEVLLLSTTTFSGCTPCNVQIEDIVVSRRGGEMIDVLSILLFLLPIRTELSVSYVVLTIRIGTSPGVNKNREKLI